MKLDNIRQRILFMSRLFKLSRLCEQSVCGGIQSIAMINNSPTAPRNEEFNFKSCRRLKRIAIGKRSISQTQIPESATEVYFSVST